MSFQPENVEGERSHLHLQPAVGRREERQLHRRHMGRAAECVLIRPVRRSQSDRLRLADVSSVEHDVGRRGDIAGIDYLHDGLSGRFIVGGAGVDAVVAGRLEPGVEHELFVEPAFHAVPWIYFGAGFSPAARCICV